MALEAIYRAGLLLKLTDQFSRPSKEAMKNIKELEERARSMEGTFRKVAEAGAIMTGTGLAMAGAFAIPVIAAANFQDAMADVQKVANFTSEEYERFSQTLLNMSKRIPIAAEGLAAIAAAGARMGVANKDLAFFTETVSKMSTALELDPGTLATNLGNLSTIFQIPITGIGLLGDAINTLDDNMNATAADIIDVMIRMGNSAKNLNIPAEQAAALGSALLSTGLSAEVVGTGLNRLLTTLPSLAVQSEDAQEQFSRMGINAEEFSRAFRERPIEALKFFIEMVRETGNGMEILLEIFGRDAGPKILSFVNNAELLEKGLGFVSEETKYAGSVQKEFERRLETLNVQIQLTKQSIAAAAKTIGGPWLDTLSNVFERIRPAIDAMSQFAEKHQTLTKIIFGTVGAVGIFLVVAGGFLTFIGVAGIGVSKLILLFTAMPGVLGLIATAFGLVKAAAAFLLLSPWGLVIAAIAVGAYLIYKNWDLVKEQFMKLWAIISDGVKRFSKWFHDVIPNALNVAWAAIKRFANPLQLVADLFRAIQNFKMPSLGSIGNLLGGGQSALGVMLKAPQPVTAPVPRGPGGWGGANVSIGTINVSGPQTKDPQGFASEVGKRTAWEVDKKMRRSYGN